MMRDCPLMLAAVCHADDAFVRKLGKTTGRYPRHAVEAMAFYVARMKQRSA